MSNESVSHDIQDRLNFIEQAMDKAAEGIVITDARLPENPIIYANMGFQHITGYPREFIIGKNCRFLQGADTDKDAIEIIRNAINNQVNCIVELLNYRKDGTPFWNRLSITPLFDEHGKISHFVGVQSDITELKNTKHKLEEANRFLQHFYEKMTKELHRAKQSMESIMPQQMPRSDSFKIAARFNPLTEIGGDFFDVFKILDTVYGVVIADVTGHGIPAALLSYMSLTTFRKTAASILSTSSVIEKTNGSLYQNMPEGNFISMFYMIYNEETRELTYTQAGHPPAFLIRQDPLEVHTLTTNNILVGLFPNDQVKFSQQTMKLKPGDKVLMYTDAVIEAGFDDSTTLDPVTFSTFLKAHADLEPRDMIQTVYDHGLNLSGRDKYGDDVTLICFEVLYS